MRRAALGATIALALAGCGSSALSAGQVRTRATTICTVAARRAASITLPEAPSGGGPFLTRGIAVLGPELAQLRTLGDSGSFRVALTATRAELAALRFTVRGLHAGNDPVVAIKTLEQRLLPLGQRANQAWRRLQIPACVSR